MENTMTPQQFQAWLTGAQKGSKTVYHVGQYADGATCQAAMNASDAGLVHLAQRAVMGSMGNRKFEYIAQSTVKGYKK